MGWVGTAQPRKSSDVDGHPDILIRVLQPVFAARLGRPRIFPTPQQGEAAAKPALAEFRGLLRSTEASQEATTHEQSEKALQQFMQWRQKANTGETSQ